VCSPPEGNEEVCNGLDDDCDDEIDEGGLCAARFLDSCTVWLGWTAVEGAGIPPNHRDAQANWAACPTMPSENDSETATCTRAGRDGEFQGLNVGTGTLGLYDYLAVALTCDQGDPLARWMQSHCTAYIGQSDVPNFATPSARWAECPDSDESADLIERSICTSSARDGQFHSMRVIGLVDLTDRFAVALKCTPRGQPDPNVGDPSAVASAIESGVELVLGWAPSTPAQVNGRLEWLYPCLTDQEQDFGSPPEGNCVSSTGDGQFHGSWVGNRGPANAPTVFGIALRALQD